MRCKAKPRRFIFALVGVYDSAIFKSLEGSVFFVQISPSYIPINRDWGPFRVGSGRTASSTVLPEGFIFCRRPIPRPVLTELSPLWPSCAPPQAPGRNCTRSLRGLHAERPYLWVEWTYAPRTTAPAPGPAPASGCRGSAVLDVSQESRRAALPVRGSWVLLRRSDAVSSLSP